MQIEKIFAIDKLKALKHSSDQDRKHVLRLLRLYGGQAFVISQLVCIFARVTLNDTLLQNTRPQEEERGTPTPFPAFFIWERLK